MPGNKAALVRQPNAQDPPSALDMVDGAKPTPSAGQVLVRLRLRTVNPADVMKVRT